MGWNKREWDRTRLNSNGIGFENTVDYYSLMENELF
jgi:hypothetical protein